MAVTTTTEFGGTRRQVIRLQSDAGVAEAAVKKVDVSTLTLDDGTAPSTVRIMNIEWDIIGFEGVQLLWDATANVPIKTLSTQGSESSEKFGGIVNPKTSGYTGDILLTTLGETSGDTYDIRLEILLEV